MEEEMLTEDSEFDDLQKKVANEAKLKTHKKNFAQKRQELIETTANFVNEFGEESEYTQMMLEILEVVEEMQTVLKVLDGVKIAYDTIFGAMDIMDDVMISFETMFDFSNGVKYGPLQNWQRRRKFRKTIRNNQGRIDQMVNYFTGMSTLGKGMVKSLRGALGKMNDTRKKDKNKSSSTVSDSILKTVREAAAKQKGEVYTDTSASAPAGSSAADNGNPFGGNEGV